MEMCISVSNEYGPCYVHESWFACVCSVSNDLSASDRTGAAIGVPPWIDEYRWLICNIFHARGNKERYSKREAVSREWTQLHVFVWMWLYTSALLSLFRLVRMLIFVCSWNSISLQTLKLNSKSREKKRTKTFAKPAVSLTQDKGVGSAGKSLCAFAETPRAFLCFLSGQWLICNSLELFFFFSFVIVDRVSPSLLLFSLI